jgi:DNA repair exonuclease SbcCD ATPase subunit
MKKRYIFLIVSLVSVASITYLLKKDLDNEFIRQTEKEINSMHEERDSVFLFADEVLEGVTEQKKVDSLKLTDLDEKVKNKQITIEQQVSELKELVKKANDLKELAEEEKNKAITVERMAKQQQMEAEKARHIMMTHMDSLQVVTKGLMSEIKTHKKDKEKLEKEIKRLNSLLESIKEKHKPTEEDYSGDEKKKRKKGGN